jgi:hypothetical protein
MGTEKKRLDVRLTAHVHLVQRFRTTGAIPPVHNIYWDKLILYLFCPLTIP